MANKKAWTPAVLVLDEKHGLFFMDASTEEALHRSALSVLRGRVKLGHWYDQSVDKNFLVDAQRAINKKDGKFAWELLRDRRSYEYEGIDLDQLRTKYFSGDSDDA